MPSLNFRFQYHAERRQLSTYLGTPAQKELLLAAPAGACRFFASLSTTSTVTDQTAGDDPAANVNLTSSQDPSTEMFNNTGVDLACSSQFNILASRKVAALNNIPNSRRQQRAGLRRKVLKHPTETHNAQSDGPGSFTSDSLAWLWVV
jgi:hypothetical protein